MLVAVSFNRPSLTPSHCISDPLQTGKPPLQLMSQLYIALILGTANMHRPFSVIVVIPTLAPVCSLVACATNPVPCICPALMEWSSSPYQ